MVDRVLRRTVDQLADAAPMVQVLDTPVPQMMEQLLEVLRRLDIEVPAQVIEVPKISQDSIPERLVDCDLRTEALYSDPAIDSRPALFSRVQRTACPQWCMLCVCLFSTLGTRFMPPCI